MTLLLWWVGSEPRPSGSQWPNFLTGVRKKHSRYPDRNWSGRETEVWVQWAPGSPQPVLLPCACCLPESWALVPPSSTPHFSSHGPFWAFWGGLSLVQRDKSYSERERMTEALVIPPLSLCFFSKEKRNGRDLRNFREKAGGTHPIGGPCHCPDRAEGRLTPFSPLDLRGTYSPRPWRAWTFGRNTPMQCRV